MTTIKVLTSTLAGGYGPICNFYNANKPEGSMPISPLQRAEGGFQISFSPEEKKDHLGWLKSRSSLYDDNDTIRQLRWSDGKLLSQGYIGFTEEQTQMLFTALKNTVVQVVMV
jgi:hypothetical protein